MDGFVAGAWRLDPGAARLTIRAFEPLSAQHVEQAEAEGVRLLRFATDKDASDVRIEVDR